MKTAPFHVMIIGGGIGGLCLAQGLKRAGVSVAVYERDHTRSDRLQGYRIHINPAGSRALQACLPPDLYAAFLQTCGKSGHGFSFLNDQLDELLGLDMREWQPVPDPVNSHQSVSRITLRQVLLAGLDEIVHFDKRFVRYEELPDGAIRAHFEDGSTATGDIMVAADGANSRVRRQLLPHAQRIDTGILGIAAKVPLTPATAALLPAQLFIGPASVLGRKGYGMFLAVQEFAQPGLEVGAVGGNDGNATLNPGMLFDNTQNYIMWSFSARRGKYPFPGKPEDLDGAALQAIVLDLIGDWHPSLREMVRAADPATVTLLPIFTSLPIEPWPTGRVTLLGDAIHSMTPFRGIGANIALRDAELLCQRLTGAAKNPRVAAGDRQPLLAAIGDYEAAMLKYGFAAVRDSRRAAEQAVGENRLALALTKTVFRAINAMPRLKRMMFGRTGE